MPVLGEVELADDRIQNGLIVTHAHCHRELSHSFHAKAIRVAQMKCNRQF